MENWIAKFNRDRKTLIDYYENLYKEDNEFIKKKALEYSDGDKEKAKDYLAGYLESIKQPHTKIIKLIEMYVVDHMPRFRSLPSDEKIISNVREIFRKEICPKSLFEDENINFT